MLTVLNRDSGPSSRFFGGQRKVNETPGAITSSTNRLSNKKKKYPIFPAIPSNSGYLRRPERKCLGHKRLDFRVRRKVLSHLTVNRSLSTLMPLSSWLPTLKIMPYQSYVLLVIFTIDLYTYKLYLNVYLGIPNINMCKQMMQWCENRWKLWLVPQDLKLYFLLRLAKVLMVPI